MLHQDKRKRGDASELLRHPFIRHGKQFYRSERKIAKLNGKVHRLQVAESGLERQNQELKDEVDALVKSETRLKKQKQELWSKVDSLQRSTTTPSKEKVEDSWKFDFQVGFFSQRALRSMSSKVVTSGGSCCCY